MAIELTEYEAILRRWQQDPVAFYDDVFREKVGEPLDPWQVDALRALTTRDRVAFVASKGVGKSFLEAVAGWWWMVTRKEAQVICTSITASNLKSGLWKEIRGLYELSTLLQAEFQMNSERAQSKTHSKWFIEARSWRDHVDPVEQAQALAGLHGPAMMWLGDEAGSYGHAILASGSAMMANVNREAGREAKMLLGGNPTDPKGPLGDIARDPEHWAVVRINGDPDNPNRSNRINLQWAQEEIAKHGRDNPWVKVSVLGEFPDVGFRNLLGPDDIDKAKKRVYSELDYQHAQKRIGVDVALGGDDATVICIRQGLRAGQFVEMRTDDPQVIANRVAKAVERSGAEVVYVDKTGVGVSVFKCLQTMNVRVVGVDNAQAASDERYLNSRAEQWFRLAEWVKDGGWLSTSYDQLEKDLMAPEYSFKQVNKRTVMMIQPKDEIKKVLGRSPDYGDALALTFVAPERQVGSYRDLVPGFITKQSGKNNSDFDPHREYNGRGASTDFDPLDSSKL